MRRVFGQNATLSTITSPLRRRAPTSLFDAVLNAPGAVLGFVVVVFALGLVLILGFRVNDGSLLGAGFTFGNMSSAIQDPLYARVVLRSLVIAGAVILLPPCVRFSCALEATVSW